MTRLASDLLVIARAGEGQLPVRPQVVDVAVMLRASAERFDRIARTEGRIEARASAAGIGLAAYRKSLRTRFEQRLGEMRRFESGGSG